MSMLPVWAQVVIYVLGAGAIANILGILTLVVTVRQKNQELKDLKAQRLNDNLLQNTRTHIDPLYIPINKLLATLESTYGEYKVAGSRYVGYERAKHLEETETQASIELGLLLASNKHEAIVAFTKACQNLRDYQEKMIVEGTSAYFPAEFDKQLDSFIRFLYGVGIVSHTYLLSLKDVPEEQANVYVLGTPEFEKELYEEIDFIRAYIRELTLGTTDILTASSRVRSKKKS